MTGVQINSKIMTLRMKDHFFLGGGVLFQNENTLDSSNNTQRR